MGKVLFSNRLKLQMTWEILQHLMRAAILERTILVGVAMRIRAGDGRA